MSRRGIIIIVASVAAILLGNIVILSVWLPRSQKPAVTTQTASPVATAVTQASMPPQAPNNASSPVSAPPLAAPRPVPVAAELPAGFVVERQVLSPSGNLRIKYLRDRKQKLRRITLEDIHRPGAASVLSESKQNAWIVVSPDDQWIALDERTGPGGGGARLYHRQSTAEVRYDLVDDSPATRDHLQDVVWSAYLDATQSDPKTSRDGVTIDATAWDSDSRKLILSVAYLAPAGKSEIPQPWTCTYDVVSKQVEPTPPAESADENASASPAARNVIPQDTNQENAIPQDASQENAIPQTDSPQEVATDTEFPGEKFPATREEELTVPDVNESSLSDVTYAINEMYARHGADFKDKKVAKQFSDFSWYQPKPGLSTDEAENEFSDLEKQNLQVLQRCRDAKIAATHRHQRAVRGTQVHEETAPEHFIKGVLQALTPDQ